MISPRSNRSNNELDGGGWIETGIKLLESLIHYRQLDYLVFHRLRYFAIFCCGIAVLSNFSCGIAVLGPPPHPEVPLLNG